MPISGINKGLNDAPRYLIRDRDLALATVHATADAMAITEVLTSPRSPWQNGVVEQFIGSVRGECLDHVIVFTALGLQRVMFRFAADLTITPLARRN